MNSWKPFSKELYSNLKFLFICSPSVCKPAEEDQYSINKVCVWRQQQAHFIITTIWIEHTHWILRLFLVVNLPCYLSLNTTLAQRALTSSFNMVSSMLCKTTRLRRKTIQRFPLTTNTQHYISLTKKLKYHSTAAEKIKNPFSYTYAYLWKAYLWMY